ncbi:glycosyltransferase family 2 protein [Cytobacillus depressus]|uniref:Glycosyltransferase family 2 protein n=1 Tax=Cytobacillus depressus TaxID=1602942 RepID=A0A6L3V802_9BACI|nr:glycosyltransferase [Cytobacillus depressus]KAB2336727.1 glycosyltransferase family 2 protein [Cytobacillus depressus]
MILKITIVLFCVFGLFHTIYIFIPLYTNKTQKRTEHIQEAGMSLLIPAYNESLVIKNCLMGIHHVNYSNLEVLFINDGSTDNTFGILNELLILKKTSRTKIGLLKYKKVNGIYYSEKFPNIFVIDKENGGKADALNAGIEFAKKEIIITLDADSILEPNSLNEMNKAFSNPKVVAAGGLVNIIQGYKNERKTLLPSFRMSGLIRFQILQYLTAFYLHKTTQAKLRAITVIAGAFGAFRKNVLLMANGYRKTVGEDMDITLRIQELIGTKMKGKRIVFVPEAVCFTECPESFRNLFRQRIRWQKAFVDCVITHRKSFYRKMNFGASTYLIFDSLLLGTLSAYSTLLVPIVVLMTMSHLKLAFLLLCISISLAILQNIATLIVSGRYGHKYARKDLISLLFFIPFEVMFYRFTGLLFVSIGTILYFFDKEGWSRSERIGKQVVFNNEGNVTENMGG